jgi:hypothetical protein
MLTDKVTGSEERYRAAFGFACAHLEGDGDRINVAYQLLCAKGIELGKMEPCLRSLADSKNSKTWMFLADLVAAGICLDYANGRDSVRGLISLRNAHFGAVDMKEFNQRLGYGILAGVISGLTPVFSEHSLLTGCLYANYVELLVTLCSDFDPLTATYRGDFVNRVSVFLRSHSPGKVALLRLLFTTEGSVVFEDMKYLIARQVQVKVTGGKALVLESVRGLEDDMLATAFRKEEVEVEQR